MMFAAFFIISLSNALYMWENPTHNLLYEDYPIVLDDVHSGNIQDLVRHIRTVINPASLQPAKIMIEETSSNLTIKILDGEFQEIKRLHDKNITECEEACNNTDGCSKHIVDPQDDCTLYKYFPLPECKAPFFPVGQKCLLVVDDEEVTWDVAQERCKALGGRLAELDDPDRFSLYIVENHPLDALIGVWLGACTTRDPPEWHWNSTGVPFDEYFPWGAGYPIGSYNNLRRECLSLIVDTDGVCKYSDQSCDSKHAYICEEVIHKKMKECYLPFTYLDEACILILEQRFSWNKAIQRCHTMNGRLYQPRNPLKFLDYVTQRYGTPHHTRGMWLGAHLEKPKWSWMGSSTVVAHDFPWGKDKEDPSRREKEECMSIYAKRGMPFTYEDANCLTKQFYVCENKDCSPPYEKIGDRCLLVVEERRNWQHAQESCMKDYGGRLAEVKDPENFRKFMHDNYYDPEDYQQEYWLGAKAKKIIWRWNNTGQAIPSDFPWGDGQPSGYWKGYNEECMNLFSNGVYSWKYNDAHCSNRYFFVCELLDTIPPSTLLIGNVIFDEPFNSNISSKELLERTSTGHTDELYSNKISASSNNLLTGEIELQVTVFHGLNDVLCKDFHPNCKEWIAIGWCELAAITEQCRRSCNACNP